MTRQRSAAPVMAVAVFSLLALLLVYVLSIGPASWLIINGYLYSQQVEWFYFPLIWLAQQSETLLKMLEWYLSFFE